MSISCDKIKQHILDHIKKNELKLGDRLPSLRAIAAESGASMPTVQRAIAILVSDGTLESKVGSGTYIADSTNLESSLIGLLTPHTDETSGDFTSDTLNGIKQTIQRAGFSPVVLKPLVGYRGEEREAEELRLVKRLLKLDVRGLIIDASAQIDSPIWTFLKQLNIPVVCVNNSDNSNALNFVTSDNNKIGAMAAQHFLDKKHLNLGVVTNSFFDSISVLERVRGFKETALKQGITPSVISIKDLKSIKSDDIDEQKVLQKCRGLTALFCINDGIAVQLINAFRKLGFDVPREVSFIGVDDSFLCLHSLPPLTSIKQSSRRMGEKAAEILLDLLENGSRAKEITRVVLEPILVKRESVAYIA